MVQVGKGCGPAWKAPRCRNMLKYRSRHDHRCDRLRETCAPPATSPREPVMQTPPTATPLVHKLDSITALPLRLPEEQRHHAGQGSPLSRGALSSSQSAPGAEPPPIWSRKRSAFPGPSPRTIRQGGSEDREGVERMAVRCAPESVTRTGEDR